MPINPAEFDSLVNIYEAEIDGLLNVMGKPCLLVFHETIINPSEETNDPVRNDSRKPFYESNVPIPVSNRETKVIKALTKHGPSDYETFGVKVKEPRDIVRLKTFLTDVPDLKRCDYIIPDLNVKDVVGLKYRLIREPVPRGLKRNRYAVSYWALA